MATQSAATVDTVLQEVSDLRGETSTNSSAVRIRAVSKAERDYAKRQFWTVHLIPEQSIGTGDGVTSSFTIGSTLYPMRLHGLFEVFVGGTTEDKRYEILEYKDYRVRYNADSTSRICYPYYDPASDAWKVKINPTPSSGDAITASWYWEPPTRTDTSDVVVCTNMKIISRLSLAYICEGEDEDKYQENLQMAEGLIALESGVEDTPAVGTLNQVKAIENSGKSRGIGAY